MGNALEIKLNVLVVYFGFAQYATLRGRIKEG